MEIHSIIQGFRGVYNVMLTTLCGEEISKNLYYCQSKCICINIEKTRAQPYGLPRGDAPCLLFRQVFLLTYPTRHDFFNDDMFHPPFAGEALINNMQY